MNEAVTLVQRFLIYILPALLIQNAIKLTEKTQNKRYKSSQLV